LAKSNHFCHTSLKPRCILFSIDRLNGPLKFQMILTLPWNFERTWLILRGLFARKKQGANPLLSLLNKLRMGWA